jgi:hypothetical protein
LEATPESSRILNPIFKQLIWIAVFSQALMFSESFAFEGPQLPDRPGMDQRRSMSSPTLAGLVLASNEKKHALPEDDRTATRAVEEPADIRDPEEIAMEGL